MPVHSIGDMPPGALVDLDESAPAPLKRPGAWHREDESRVQPQSTARATARRSYKFRIYPTARQAESLTEHLGACCDLYNAALEQRIRAWKENGVSVGFYDQQHDLTDVRAVGLLPAGMSRRAQESALRRLDLAYGAFFRRITAGQHVGHPRFRSRSRYDSFTCPLGDGIGLRAGRLRLQAVGTIRVRWHRDLPPGADIRTVTVRRQNAGWFVVFSVIVAPTAAPPSTGAAVGVDRGVVVPFALSSGEMIEGPRARKSGAVATRRGARKVARRQRGSHRRQKAVALLARQREREAARRRDFLHKLSRRLVDENDLIAFEALKTRNMVRANRSLSREILDQGWAELVRMTTYKAEEAGRQVVLVPAPYTSQTCSVCGVIDAKSRRGVVFDCCSCGHGAHADTNAALNILAAGLAVQASTVGDCSTPWLEKGIISPKSPIGDQVEIVGTAHA